MQIYSYLICLVLLFTFNLISTRNINFDLNEQQIQTDDRPNDYQRREILLRKLTSKRLFHNENFIPIIRHAKAIVKGDPREFMG